MNEGLQPQVLRLIYLALFCSYAKVAYDRKIWFGASLSEPWIQEKPEAVYIYLYVILHSNRLIRMLKHQPLDGKDRQDAGTCTVGR